jgi:hypothetical protein
MDLNTKQQWKKPFMSLRFVLFGDKLLKSNTQEVAEREKTAVC